ncbi:PhnD/SsuA/transferrin family substrate-binding protein [uncultured Desulfobacter sp.]|uniref:phosphate/phosphite/phosphonate ABC transporter substrate-binding protein n=1 Tax=uncultured Desulfobacter sp. TaxID=240139 RepID=UPI0029F45835|nr:PhnD/SsuA/transferrin family substrate-binding protein [uncultured Desulfobacter sp.]
MLPIVAALLAAGPAKSEEIVNMGFSRSIIGEINENDTLAALKLWATQLVVKDDFQVTVHPTIYNDLGEIETAIKQKSVDLINLSAVDFYHVQDLLGHDRFIFAVYGGSIAVEYLLLVREKSGFADLQELKKSVIKFPKNAGSTLGTVWLDVQLGKAGLPAAKHFFDKVVPVNKISEAVLPVFFGKTDACLVTRHGFDTMAELNPQIAQQLRIVAASKGYIPGFLGFRKNYESIIKSVIVDNIKNWHQTPAGYQILTMFQMDDLVLNSIEILGPTMELIKEHQRLFGADTGGFRLLKKDHSQLGYGNIHEPL